MCLFPFFFVVKAAAVGVTFDITGKINNYLNTSEIYAKFMIHETVERSTEC